MIIGIDPGATGAIALLDGEQALRVDDLPTTTTGRSRSVCGALLADLVRDYMDQAGNRPTAVLERVAARPGQGVSSMFAFGRSYGVVEGVVGALGLPLRRVTPQQWKRDARLIGKPKDAARSLAVELFPEIAHRLTRVKDSGRADALLIAYFG